MRSKAIYRVSTRTGGSWFIPPLLCPALDDGVFALPGMNAMRSFFIREEIGVPLRMSPMSMAGLCPPPEPSFGDGLLFAAERGRAA